MAKKNSSNTPTKVTASSAGISTNGLFIIDDETLTDPIIRDKVFVPTIDGDLKGHGLIPRDYSIHPVDMFAPPNDMPLIDPSEYDGLIEEQERLQSSLEHICDWDSKDQDGDGYCLPAGSPVLMADGTRKPIEQVRLGDEVYTAAGGALVKRRVGKLYQRLFTGDMVRMKVDGMESAVVLTEGHPIPTPCHDPRWPDAWHDSDARHFTSGTEVYATSSDGQLEKRRVAHVSKKAVTNLQVFDIGVEEDHYFFAGDGLLVHNCWAYSTVGAMEFARRINNQPWFRLSAHAIAAIIKKGKNEGGWCGLSAKFSREVGVPSDEFWPTHSRDIKNDTAALRANAALHKVLEDWVDLTRDVYDQNLTLRQIDTCCLTNVPMAWDFNWWSHSIFGGRLINVEAGSKGRKFRNSWGNGWGEKGWGILRGSKAVPDGAIAIRVVRPSPT